MNSVYDLANRRLMGRGKRARFGCQSRHCASRNGRKATRPRDLAPRGVNCFLGRNIECRGIAARPCGGGGEARSFQISRAALAFVSSSIIERSLSTAADAATGMPSMFPRAREPGQRFCAAMGRGGRGLDDFQCCC